MTRQLRSLPHEPCFIGYRTPEAVRKKDWHLVKCLPSEFPVSGHSVLVTSPSGQALVQCIGPGTGTQCHREMKGKEKGQLSFMLPLSPAPHLISYTQSLLALAPYGCESQGRISDPQTFHSDGQLKPRQGVSSP